MCHYSHKRVPLSIRHFVMPDESFMNDRVGRLQHSNLVKLFYESFMLLQSNEQETGIRVGQFWVQIW